MLFFAVDVITIAIQSFAAHILLSAIPSERPNSFYTKICREVHGAADFCPNLLLIFFSVSESRWISLFVSQLRVQIRPAKN